MSVQNVGSSKVRNARKRLEKEESFLSSLGVQCDDEDKIDLVHDNDGNLLRPSELYRVVSGHSNVMRYVLKGQIVETSRVKSALEVIVSCLATIKRFS